MTTPSPEHVEHVARAIWEQRRANSIDFLESINAMPSLISDQRSRNYESEPLSRENAVKEARAAILSSQEWLEKNGADKEG